MEQEYKVRRWNLFMFLVMLSFLMITCLALVWKIGYGLFVMWWPFVFFEPYFMLSATLTMCAAFLQYGLYWIMIDAVKKEDTLLILCFMNFIHGTIVVNGGAAGLTAYAMSFPGRERTEGILMDTVRLYKERDEYMMSRMNTIQQTLECCGVNNVQDWKTTEAYSAHLWRMGVKIPHSCIKPSKENDRVSPTFHRRKNEDQVFLGKIEKPFDGLTDSYVNADDPAVYTTGCLQKVLEHRDWYAKNLLRCNGVLWGMQALCMLLMYKVDEWLNVDSKDN